MIFGFGVAVLSRWFGSAPCLFNSCLVLLFVVVSSCPRVCLTRGKSSAPQASCMDSKTSTLATFHLVEVH